MIYVLSKLFWIVAQPINLIVILVLLWPVLNVLGYRRAGPAFLKAALAILVSITMLPIGQMLLIPLEDRFPRAEKLPDKLAGIIVLGGSIEAELSEQRGFSVFGNALERLTETVALARRYPQARIIFTGGSAALTGSKPKEAEYARQFFVGQGLSKERVIYEDRSRNTWENVENSKALINPRPSERWVLITSAFHMPRSVGIFRKLGWNVIPDPVDYRTGGVIDVSDFRLILRIQELDLALKEWIGLMAYSALGRTSSLFPGP